MLEYDQYIPDNVAEGAPLFILLHGRGSHRGDLMGLQPALPSHAMIVTPQAPFAGGPWGYGGGWAWYKFLGGNTPEPESFEAGQEQLESFIREISHHLPVKPGILLLGGFSQGATSSMAYALRHPGEIPLVLHLSGFVANHPSVAVTPDTVRDTRFFWAHGYQDQLVPFDLAREGRKLLQDAGANLEARDYNIGHTITRTVLDDAVHWLESVLPS